MTLWDALRAEWDAMRSVLVTFGHPDGIRYTYGATSDCRTFCNPATVEVRGAAFRARRQGHGDPRARPDPGHGDEGSAPLGASGCGRPPGQDVCSRPSGRLQPSDKSSQNM